MRTAFIETLMKIARENKNIYLLTGDLGFSVFEVFQKEFPPRYLNVGIAEQTLMGASAGLGLSGKTIFAYSIASFATMRCFEQIRNDICYHNLKVRIIGGGAGFTYSSYGITHQTESDISLMRNIPNMTVVCPGDPIEMIKTIEQSENIDGPMYIRVGKKGEPILHDKDIDFKIGKGIIMKEGKDIAIIASGNTLEMCKSVAEELEKDNISVRLISMHTIKPIDKELVIDTISKINKVITVEEHSILGGLGSSVAEIISENNINKELRFKRIGIPDEFCHVAGCQEYIRDKCGFSKDKLLKEIYSILKTREK